MVRLEALSHLVLTMRLTQAIDGPSSFGPCCWYAVVHPSALETHVQVQRVSTIQHCRTL